MAKPILLKKSTVPGRVPGTQDLQVGELAVNTADRRLFSKHSDGEVVPIGAEGAELRAGQVFSNPSLIEESAETVLREHTHNMLFGPITVAGDAVWSITGSGTLKIF
jgi:hypothetical protein